MIDSLSKAVHAFVSRVSISFSVDETLLPRYVNLSAFIYSQLNDQMWCTGYCHYIDTVAQVQVLDEADRMFMGIGMNPIILLPDVGKE